MRTRQRHPGGRACRPQGVVTPGRPHDPPRRWLAQREQVDASDAVVTVSKSVTGETGIVVLDGSPDKGRRAITVVADMHL